MRPRSRVGWLALATTMTWGLFAHAAAPDAERLKTAAEEFDAGRRAFKLKDYEGSATHFENADRDAPSPEALQSAIRGRKEANQVGRALTLSAWGLGRYPTDKAFGEYAKQIISESERSLYKLTVNCQPDCSVIVDNKVLPFGETASGIVYLDPGQHQLQAGWSYNRHKNADVNAVAAQAGKLTFEAPPVEKMRSDPGESATPSTGSGTEGDQGVEKEKKGGLPPAVFFAGLGVTAVLGGVTIWSGLDTQKNPGKENIPMLCANYSNTPGPSILGPSEDCPDYKKGLANQLRTNILIGATSVVGATTIVLAVLTKWGGDPAKPEKKEAFIMPVVGVQDGVSIGAVGRF
jgi:hypothetical protein